MTTSCLVNNFNYGRYVVEAVESALRQTRPFDQIIVVDDGSTDDSLERLEAEFAKNPIVEIVAKANAGQLSCFNEGFRRATGQIVFFLDADDAYEPHYVEEALHRYERSPDCDFLYCGRRYFGQREGDSLPYANDRDLGYSVIRTLYEHSWLGGPTSCLSIKHHLLSRLLPLPLEADWRTRADDCLVFGTSLAGARKHYVAQPLVRYRVHKTNHFCGKRSNTDSTYRRRLAVNRLFGHLLAQLQYDLSSLSDFAHREFCTNPSPHWEEFRSYRRIVLSAKLSVARKLSCSGALLQHYVGSRLRASRPAAADDSGRDTVVPDLASKPSPHAGTNDKRHTSADAA